MKGISKNYSKSEKVVEILSLDEKAIHLKEIDALIEELKIEELEFQEWVKELEMKGVKFPDSFSVELTYRNEAFERIREVTFHIKSELQEKNREKPTK